MDTDRMHDDGQPVGVPLDSSSATAPAATAADSPLLTIDEFMKNEIEIAAANHQEFFVRVHECYQHETLQKQSKEAAEAAAEKAKQGAIQASGPAATIAWPFGSMETKLFMARYQIDNIVQICDHLLKASATQRNPASTVTPMLTLVERNTEVQDAKLKEQIQADKDRLRSDAEAAASAPNATDEDRAALESLLAKDEEEAEFFQDEDGMVDGGDEVLVVPDQGDAAISMETRRKRLGTLLLHKRRQYQSATSVLQRGRAELAASIDGDRKFLTGVGHLAQYWTLRTIQTDQATHTQTTQKGPLFNPYQNGLPAGTTSPYPNLMIDYRIGALDISLDRGKAWLFRNDAGDVFVDDAIGKEEQTTKPAEAAKATNADTNTDGDAKDASMVEGDGEPQASPPAEPSWVSVSQRLQRAQHQLLYKHLYNALMSEAREWRIAAHREQQVKAMHAASTSQAGGASGSASGSSLTLPPSSHAPRPWSVTEITPRQISISITGSVSGGLSLNWNRGIGCGFEVTSMREGLAGVIRPDQPDRDANREHNDALTTTLSKLICNQALSILLDQTLKNSLGSRPLLEVLQSAGSAISGAALVTESRDNAVLGNNAFTPPTTISQPKEALWPSKQPPIIQFIVMAVSHANLVREARIALRDITNNTQFRVKTARTTQPYLYAFTVLAGKKFVLEGSIRGSQFHVTTCIPPAHPSEVTYALFGQPMPVPKVSHQFALADAINVNSVQHFKDILKTAMKWNE